MLAVLGVLFIVVRLAVVVLCLVPVLVFMVADVIIPAHRGGLGKHT